MEVFFWFLLGGGGGITIKLKWGYDLIDEFIMNIEKIIIDCYKDKAVLLLSTGFDSQAVYYILKKNGLIFDIVFSSHNKTDNLDKFKSLYGNIDFDYIKCDSFEDLITLLKHFKVIYSGLLFSEYLNKNNVRNLNRGYEYHCIYRHFPNIYNSGLNFCLPMLHPLVINYIKIIDKKYPFWLSDSRISKKIIRDYKEVDINGGS